MSIDLDQALAVIEKAIEGFHGDTGPGSWFATSWILRDRPRVALVYEYEILSDDNWPLPGSEWNAADDPWKRWGGDAIAETIEKAGLRFVSGDLDRDGNTYLDAAVFSAPVDDDD